MNSDAIDHAEIHVNHVGQAVLERCATIARGLDRCRRRARGDDVPGSLASDLHVLGLNVELIAVAVASLSPAIADESHRVIAQLNAGVKRA
jgi:hypothetical protein